MSRPCPSSRARLPGPRVDAAPGLPPAALAAVAVAVLAGCAGSGGSPPSPAPSLAASILYVCVQDAARVAMVDMNTLQVIGSVELQELGFGPTSMPHHIAVEPDGSHWYVSLIGENRVLRMDARNDLRGEVTLSTPGMLDLTPGGELLITRSMSAVNPPPRVGIVGPDSWTAGAREVDVLFPRPHGIVVDASGRWAYTASLGQNRLAAIDLETERVELVDLPGPVHALVQFSISPDGRTMVASGELSGELVVLSLENPARPRLVTSVPIGTQPFDPLFSPDGATVWVPVKGTNEVVVVETSGWRVATRIRGEELRQPHALAFSPDGSRVFVTNNHKDPHAMHEAPAAGTGNGAVTSGGSTAPVPGGGAAPVEAPEAAIASLVVIDARTRSVAAAIPLGPNLTGLGSRPAY